MSPESKLTSVVRIEPRLVPCLRSGHTINRDDRFGGRSANRRTPALLPPGSGVIMTQTVTVTSGAVTDHFDHDSLEVLRPRVAGLDVHKMQVTATVRLCEPGMARPLRATREFSALAQGLGELTGWLLGHAVTAAAMEGTGIFWKAPYEALEDAGLQVELFHAQHVRQIRGRKTDRNDSIWLARVCEVPTVSWL